MKRPTAIPVSSVSHLAVVTLICVLAVGLGVSCLTLPAVAANDESNSDQNSDWIALFDGKSLAGWTTGDGDPVTRGWAVANGMIVRTGRGGYLVTERQFADFELVFEWKVGGGANSGIKYRVQDYGGHTLGCEYQIIDDRGYRYRLAPWQRTAALYAIHAPPRKSRPKPAGEWNLGRVLAHGSHIEHWLNGEKVVDADTASADWQRRVMASKFNDHPDFGRNGRGPIMIQDHGGELSIRKVDIRVIRSSD